MTEFIARDEFAPNESGGTESKGEPDCTWDFLSLDLWHSIGRHCNRLRKLFACFRPCFDQVDSSLWTSHHCTAEHSRAGVSADWILRTWWSTGIARGTEGPDKLRMNCEITDDRPIKGWPCNRSRASSHFATRVTLWESPRDYVHARSQVPADSLLLFHPVNTAIITIKDTASACKEKRVFEIHTWNILALNYLCARVCTYISVREKKSRLLVSL